MCLQASYKKKIWKKNNFFASLKSLKKGVGSGVGSGSISQRYRSAPKCHGSPTLVDTTVPLLMQILYKADGKRRITLRWRTTGFCWTGRRLGSRHGPNNYKDTRPYKCRLYWCLIEFIDWRYSQSCRYFRPALVKHCPSALYTYTHTVWKGGGVWGHRRVGALKQINTCRQVSLLVPVHFEEKADIEGWCLYIYIYYVHGSRPWRLSTQSSTKLNKVSNDYPCSAQTVTRIGLLEEIPRSGVQIPCLS